jgi:hypothetical protein
MPRHKGFYDHGMLADVSIKAPVEMKVHRNDSEKVFTINEGIKSIKLNSSL